MSATTRQPAASLQLQDFLNHSPVGRLQILTGILAFTVLICDGYDITAIGYIVPSLVPAWNVTREALGPAMVAGLFGLATGAFCGGPIADRIGRRKVIIGSVFFFGVMTLATAWATDLTSLTILRFLTGLGLGASQPNTGTLMSEFAPFRHRSIFVTLTYCGFTVGAAIGGFIAAGLIATHGWQSVLYVGGVVPLILAVLYALWLPESPRFLSMRPERHDELVSIVNRIQPGTAGPNTRFVNEAVVPGKVPFVKIVTPPYLPVTVLLWIGVFSAQVTVYLLNSWLPTLVKGAGFTLADAAMIGAMGQVGGTIGNIFIGWAMDKFEAHRVVVWVLFIGVLTAFAIGLSASGFTLSLPILMVMIFVIGLTANCSHTAWYPMSTNFYPTQVRATGMGWVTFFGRLGGISGASIGAVLLAFHLTLAQVFWFLAIPMGVGMVAAFVKGKITGRAETQIAALTAAPAE